MTNQKEWQALLERAEQVPAICLASSEEYLLQRTATQLTRALQDAWQDSEVTRISGEDFTLEEAVAAAGTISFFAPRRIVRIDRLPVTEYDGAEHEGRKRDEKELDELCDLLRDTENAIFIITVWYKTARDAKNKKVKQLAAALPDGCWLELAAPKGDALTAFAVGLAQEAGAQLDAAAAAALVQASGGNLFQLASEIAKLAAGAGYGTITLQTVEALGQRTVEADVFRMIDAVTEGRPAQAFAILDRLLYLRSEPIAILGAMASSFVDMVRVQTGARHRVGYAQVWQDLGYTGKSNYRLKRAGQTAARYTPQALRQALALLAQLDVDLKSSPVDRAVLLQTALSELCSLPRAR